MDILYLSKVVFLNVESPDQFAEFKIICKFTFVSKALLVDTDLQLQEVKSLELDSSTIVNFIHREILSFDASLCGFTVVINNAGSSDAGSLCSKYIINVAAGQRLLEVKARILMAFVCS